MSLHEDLALRQLAAELLASFPHSAAPEIDRLLAHLHDGFLGAPIREFVPVLIRRAARDHFAGREAIFAVPTPDATPDATAGRQAIGLLVVS